MLLRIDLAAALSASSARASPRRSGRSRSSASSWWSTVPTSGMREMLDELQPASGRAAGDVSSQRPEPPAQGAGSSGSRPEAYAAPRPAERESRHSPQSDPRSCAVPPPTVSEPSSVGVGLSPSHSTLETTSRAMVATVTSSADCHDRLAAGSAFQRGAPVVRSPSTARMRRSGAAKRSQRRKGGHAHQCASGNACEPGHGRHSAGRASSSKCAATAARRSASSSTIRILADTAGTCSRKPFHAQAGTERL